MKRKIIASLMLALSLALAGCNEKKAEQKPQPFALTQEAVGNYCGMNVLEHPGPKGQIILKEYKNPIWFSSARDTIAFTMLPDEPKDIAAIYVSDMAKAETWDHPGETNWIDAHDAVFVIGSRKRGGMGADEAVPFSQRDSAQSFVAENGGKVVTFDELPQDYILGSNEAADQADTKQESSSHGNH